MLFQHLVDPLLFILRRDQIQIGDKIEILGRSGCLIHPSMDGDQSPDFIGDGLSSLFYDHGMIILSA